MKVIDIERCYTCKKEKESDEHRCCSKCCGYLRDYVYRIRERMDEQRKLNHQKKNKEQDRAYWQEYQQNNRDKISERKKNTEKTTKRN